MHILVDVEVRSVLLIREGSATLGACSMSGRRIVIADHGHGGDSECFATIVQIARMLLNLLGVIMCDFLSHWGIFVEAALRSMWVLGAERISILGIFVVHAQVLGHFRITICDCLQIHLSSVLLICNFNFLLPHEVFVLSTLLKVISNRFLPWMHRWMINFRQFRHISCIPSQQFDLGRPNTRSLSLLATCKALSSDFNTFLGTSISVKFDQLLLFTIRVRLRTAFLFLIDENLAPQRILAPVELLLRLEEGFAGHLFLTLLFSPAANPCTLIFHFVNDALEASHEIGPVLFTNGATNLITA